jgi:RNA polymerase sigma factor (sigma-70 family)
MPAPTSERQLVRAAVTGSEKARRALVQAFMPRIQALARTRARDAHIPARELARAGELGLLRALERYDPESATPFWEYASWWVRQAMVPIDERRAHPRAEEAANHAVRRLTIRIVWKWFESLSDREQTIVRARYEPNAPRQTLRGLGARLGLSAEGVRRADQRALTKLHLPAAPDRRST